MGTLRQRAAKRYREDGLRQLLFLSCHFIYENFIRLRLPERAVSYNGVKVHDGETRLGDTLVPWRRADIPEYEEAIIRSIRKHVGTGERVVIVGGGWGVSTVVAAKSVGGRGTVTTFEGSENAVKNVRETVNLNGVREEVTIHHAIVSQAYSLRGEKGEAPVISPNRLSDCDVLVLDCEGAEADILSKMDIRPRTLIVETHGMFGSGENIVREKIKDIGYRITDCRVAEERVKSFCEENGIYVLTAVHPETE